MQKEKERIEMALKKKEDQSKEELEERLRQREMEVERVPKEEKKSSPSVEKSRLVVNCNNLMSHHVVCNLA